MVIDGVEHSFGNLDALVERTQSYAEDIQRDWRNRGSEVTTPEALAWLIRCTDAITALTEAGLTQLDQEKAEADAALAEIDQLVGGF